MVRLALVGVVAVFSLAAVQDEMVENPEYKGWAGQKAGAWVKLKMVNDMGAMKVEGEITAKLKELTPEKAVVDQTTVVEMMGQKNETTTSRSVTAKIKKGTDSEGGKVEQLEEGDEELEIKGKKYKCHWVKMKIISKAGTSIVKNWRCDQIVGGTAKMEMTMESPVKMSVTMTVVDWKATE